MSAVATRSTERIRPQAGPQERFLGCRSDIAFMGGSVFGGKTWALTYQPLAHIGVPGFACVTFRRTRPDIRNPGSLWDESLKWYPDHGGEPREHALEWGFPAGPVIKFDGLQHEADVLSWKSSQIPLLQFDQLEEFTEYQFWYMQSRNRSGCGVKSYTRASCNALADTWLAELIQWWWSPETGYALPERSGIARWFLRVNDALVWSTVTCPADAPKAVWANAVLRAKAELETRYPGLGRFARSLAFVRAALADNRIGVALDPEYEARVRTLSVVEQERLLGGNWKIRPAAGLVFNRGWFEIIPVMPGLAVERVRYWDKAGTAGDGDWTVGTLMAYCPPWLVIEDVIRGRWAAGDRERVILQAARTDPVGTIIGLEQEPGSGGKDSARFTIERLVGYPVFADRPTGQLIERAQPLAAQAQVGNVKLLAGPWNAAWLHEAHAFPTPGVPDDQIASASGAVKLLRFGLEEPAGSYITVRARA